MKSLFWVAGVAAYFLPISVVVAAPKPKPRVLLQSKASVAPRARAIFARAEKLYRGAQGLRFNWSVRNEKTNKTDARELRFDRKGRFLLRPFNTSIDNQISGIYNKYDNTYGQEKLTPDRLRDEVEHELQVAASVEDGLEVVGDKSPLEEEAVQDDMASNDFQTLRATTLPAQVFKGQSCDVVRITKTTRVFKDSPFVTGEQIFWFARSDGRLMRWQTRKDGEEIEQTDAQVTLQEFNPKFGAGEFALTVPKNAKRQTLGP